MSFKFKKFAIDDSDCAQKVGTDGVMIGAWADVSGASNVLDIGAGSGLVSLMVAQRTQGRSVHITAVEIDEKAVLNCRDNFEKSPWANRLKVINSDFQQIPIFSDLIISNPPFFCGDLAAKGDARMLARQGITLNYFTLIDYASEHLSQKGILSFTSDVRLKNEILFRAELNKLYLKRICYVSGKEGNNPIRILWEFSRESTLKTIKESLNHRNADGSYHSDYINLTKDFYINL